MLQIGDTGDSYNQLRVSINDTHTKAMGIDGISIADQTSAASAIDKIKAAINYVSDVRGTLGVTQNRLDHIINNLAVMTENIQDAESTIRDVDVAEEMFPRSIFVRTDIQFYAAEHAWQKMDCPETIRRGEQYLQALKDYRERNFDLGDLNTGTIQTVLAHVETNLHPCLALAYLYEGQPDKAAETLTVLDYDTMDPGQTSVLTAAMLRLHALSDVDTEPLLREFWERISQPKPTKRMATDRREAFIAIGAPCFGAEYRKEETARILDPTAPLSLDTNAMTVEEWQILSTLPVYRHTYTLFLPLLGQCELGAAAIMDSNEPADMTKLLASIEHIQELPISALFHVLERGVAFPLKERPLNLEEMDSLAGRLIRLKSRQSSGRRIRISMR